MCTQGEISDKQCFTDKDSSRMAMYWPDVERSDWPVPPDIVRKQETIQRRKDAHIEKTAAAEQGREQEHCEYPATEDSGQHLQQQQQQQEHQNEINDTNVILTPIE